MASIAWLSLRVQCKLSLSAPYKVEISNRIEETVVVLSCIVSQGFVALISTILFAYLKHGTSHWVISANQSLTSFFATS